MPAKVRLFMKVFNEIKSRAIQVFRGLIHRVMRSGRKSRRVKRIVGKNPHWSENIMRLRDGLYQTQASISNSNQQIALFDQTRKIAFELKASARNPEAELAKTISKTEAFNQNSQLKIELLVFITEKLAARKLQSYLRKKFTEQVDFDIEIIGV